MHPCPGRQEGSLRQDTLPVQRIVDGELRGPNLHHHHGVSIPLARDRQRIDEYDRPMPTLELLAQILHGARLLRRAGKTELPHGIDRFESLGPEYRAVTQGP